MKDHQRGSSKLAGMKTPDCKDNAAPALTLPHPGGRCWTMSGREPSLVVEEV